MRTTRHGAFYAFGASAVVSAFVLTGCGTASGAGGSSVSAAAQSATSATAAGDGLRCTAGPVGKSSTPTLKLPDKKSAAGKTFDATIDTNCGKVTVQLFGDKAPQTVASFIALAKSYYSKSPCHRLTTDGIFVLQCGDPTGTGEGAPGYEFGVENAPTDGRYPAGTLAMARSTDPNTNGGQFFVVYRATELPDPTGYTIFGKVTAGLPMLRALAAQGTDNGLSDGHPKQPIGILKITVTEKKA